MCSSAWGQCALAEHVGGGGRDRYLFPFFGDGLFRVMCNFTMEDACTTAILYTWMLDPTEYGTKQYLPPSPTFFQFKKRTESRFQMVYSIEMKNSEAVM